MAGALAAILGHGVRLDASACHMSPELATISLLLHAKKFQIIVCLNHFYLEFLLYAAKLNPMICDHKQFQVHIFPTLKLQSRDPSSSHSQASSEL